MSPEVAAFALEHTAELDALEEPGRRPARPRPLAWTAVAAVLGSFRPSQLRPLPGTRPGRRPWWPWPTTFISFDGSWVLQQ